MGVVCMWGPIEILVNRYLWSTSGYVRISAFADMDWGVRQPKSFAVFNDMVPGA
jgi:hypothetical protein